MQSSVLPTWWFHQQPQQSVRIIGITTGRSCTLEITATPNTFTHQYEQAAKLLNTPFVGNLKSLQICIRRTVLHGRKYHLKVRADRKCQSEIYLKLLSALTFSHPAAAAFSWDHYLSPPPPTGSTTVRCSGLLLINWQIRKESPLTSIDG